MSRPIPTDIAQMLFQRAFDKPRDPRSLPYRLGVLDLLKWRDRCASRRPGSSERDARSLVCPFQLGTADADAWFSGTDEGHRLWAQHAAQQADAAVRTGGIESAA